MPEEKIFFRGRRCSVYCKGGRLTKNKKTDVRYWRLKLAITVEPGDAHACGGAILSNYEQIQARENAVGKIEIDGTVGGHVATFFADEIESRPILRLDNGFIEKLAMTYADGLTELWFVLEHENTDKLHRFVKDYAFTRFFVEFVPAQRTIGEAIAEGIAETTGDPESPLQQLADKDGVTMTLTQGGKKLAEFKPKGRAN